MIDETTGVITDPALPQLTQVLDPVAMGQVLVRAVPGSAGLDPAGCRVHRIRLRPNRNCEITYTLGNPGLIASDPRAIVLTILACREGESRQVFQKASAAVDFEAGRGILHIPEIEAVAWIFPGDRKLRGISKLLDMERTRGEVLPAIASFSGRQLNVNGARQELAQYVPARACTVRLEVPEDSLGATQLTLFGKTYAGGESEPAWRVQQSMWRSSARERGELLIAQPLFHDAETGTIWQSAVAGRSLHDLRTSGRDEFDLMQKAAKAVALLHLADIDAFKSDHNLGDSLLDAGKLIGSLIPALSKQLETIISRLIAQHPGPGRLSTLHGDLHLKNIFFDGSRVGFIDLDNIGRGDPLKDVGSLAASLYYRAMTGGQPKDSTAEAIARFIAEYQRHIEVPPELLNWHIATALITERAYRCITRVKLRPPGILRRLVTLAGEFGRLS